jgi:hypothetical protein
MTKKVLITGDSFAADWSVKYHDYPGWPNLLSRKYTVTNLAQAGCSEYKIWQQIESADLSLYDAVIVSHTSPYRLPVENHPVHKDDALHKDCDLIYTDIKESGKKDLHSIVEFFEKYFHTDYAKFVHQLIISHELNYISQHCKGPILTISNLDCSHLVSRNEFLDFSKLFREQRGIVNHFSEQANQKICTTIEQWLTTNLPST